MPLVNTTSHTLTNTSLHDSTYHRDSIYIREYIRGDTIYIDRWRDRWRERILTRTDTIYQDKEIVVHSPPERYVPRAVRWLAWIGCVAILVFLLWLFLKIRG